MNDESSLEFVDTDVMVYAQTSPLAEHTSWQRSWCNDPGTPEGAA